MNSNSKAELSKREQSGMSSMLTIVSAILSAVVMGWGVFGSPSRRVIQAMGESFHASLVIAMAEPETMADYIKRLEHEMMIEGHQYECEICIENNMTLRQKAIRAMKERWNV